MQRKCTLPAVLPQKQAPKLSGVILHGCYHLLSLPFLKAITMAVLFHNQYITCKSSPVSSFFLQGDRLISHLPPQEAAASLKPQSFIWKYMMVWDCVLPYKIRKNRNCTSSYRFSVFIRFKYLTKAVDNLAHQYNEIQRTLMQSFQQEPNQPLPDPLFHLSPLYEAKRLSHRDL